MVRTVFKNRFVLSLVVVFTIIFFHYLKILSPIERAVVWIISPFQSAIYSATDRTLQVVSRETSRAELLKENVKLEEKIYLLEQQLVDLKVFIEENGILEQQNEYLETNKLGFVNARVFARSATQNPNLIVINKGLEAGIKLGSAVVAGEGSLIGRIIKVENNRAFVLLLFDNQSQINSSLAGKSETVGLLVGRHNISVELDFILKEAEINKGDLVVTSGLDENVPAGLLIGEVEDIIEDKNNLFKKASVVPAVDLRNLRIVSVVLE